jgi:hypothetical protein
MLDKLVQKGVFSGRLLFFDILPNCNILGSYTMKHLIKTIFFFTFLLFSGTIVVAQMEDKSVSRDKFIFDISYNSWLNSPDKISHLHWKSIGVGLNFYKDIPLGKSSNSFAIGLGYTIDKVHSNVKFSYRSVGVYKVLGTDQQGYLENKLVTQYLELPIEFRFRTKGEAALHCHLGIKGGYLIHDFMRVKELGNKVKRLDHPHLRKFRYGPSFRFGYSNFNVFAYYSLSPLFDNSDDFQAISVGVSYFSGR